MESAFRRIMGHRWGFLFHGIIPENAALIDHPLCTTPLLLPSYLHPSLVNHSTNVIACDEPIYEQARPFFLRLSTLVPYSLLALR